MSATGPKVVPAEGVSFFTPKQSPPAGTAVVPQPNGSEIPSLFQPFTIRGITLQNRIILPPLCQYSSQDGHLTPWHLAHLGGIISRGPGLAIIESTAVLPDGRITPQDSGLWQDSQIEPVRKIVEFAHSQGQSIGIQLGHAGRKASTLAPWLGMGAVATEEQGGWPENVKGPSNVPWNDHFARPKEMTIQDIEEFKAAYVAAAKRAIIAGIDVIEIHNAHGYLLHSFLSPISNKRTDAYGGSFENRTRLTLEIVDSVRAIIPESMPLFLRISATDGLEHSSEPSWSVEQTIRLAKILAEHGVDVLDVSSGGSSPEQKITPGPGYQAPFAKAVKEAVGGKLIVSTVGSITSGKQAQELLDQGVADVIMAGRQFLKNPGLVWAWAEELDIAIRTATQIGWPFGGRVGGGHVGGGTAQKKE